MKPGGRGGRDTGSTHGEGAGLRGQGAKHGERAEGASAAKSEHPAQRGDHVVHQKLEKQAAHKGTEHPPGSQAAGKGREGRDLPSARDQLQRQVEHYGNVVKGQLTKDLKGDWEDLKQVPGNIGKSLKEVSTAVSNPAATVKRLERTVTKVQKEAGTILKHPESLGPAVKQVVSEEISGIVKEVTRQGTKTPEQWVANATHVAHDVARDAVKHALDRGVGRVLEKVERVSRVVEKLERLKSKVKEGAAVRKIEGRRVIVRQPAPRELKEYRKALGETIKGAREAPAEAAREAKLERRVGPHGEKVRHVRVLEAREGGRVGEIEGARREGVEAQHKSVERKDQLPGGSRKKAVCCSHGSEQEAVSGYKRASPTQHEVTPEMVRDHCEQNLKPLGFKLRGNLKDWGKEGGFHGKYQCSHAEVKDAIANPNTPRGVTQPMCDGCKEFHKYEAIYQKHDQVVTDSHAERIFQKDGGLVERWHDGSVTVWRPDGSVTHTPPREIVTHTPPRKTVGPPAPRELKASRKALGETIKGGVAAVADDKGVRVFKRDGSVIHQEYGPVEGQ